MNQSLHNMFDQPQRERVNHAVANAEQQTSAQIVTVITRQSGRYDRPEDIIGLVLAIIAAAALTALWPEPPQTQPGDFATPATAWLPLLLPVAILAAFFLGAFIGSRFIALRRMFTPPAQMIQEVEQRAAQSFFDQRVHHTTAQAGLLLFVSLYERRAVVLADAAVTQAIEQNGIDELCNHLTEQLRAGSPITALCSTIERAAEALAQKLPNNAATANELPNALILID